MNENELYKNYDISVRDLMLYIYLNIIEYIENSDIKTRYKIKLLNAVEEVINEHILYSIWFFTFSNNYIFEEFKNKTNNGEIEIEKIIRFVRHKEKIKFSKINKDILKTYYKNILIKFVYNIKINRDYYNITNKSIEDINKYDNKYLINKNENEEIYKNLINVINIKNNIKINDNYNKNIINLLNITIKIILFYRNLYIYINDICKFYSINNLRTKNEINYNIKTFSDYLNIKKFMKNNFIKNKRLVIDNEIIICKSIKDFNKYINKLLKKVNKLDIDFLTEKWDLINIKLKKMNIFTEFEIECIKLIISIKYNDYLLIKSNKFINNYNINKRKFKKYLEKYNINYKNLKKYNNDIHNIHSSFTGINLSNLLKNKNCLEYF